MLNKKSNFNNYSYKERIYYKFDFLFFFRKIIKNLYKKTYQSILGVDVLE